MSTVDSERPPAPDEPEEPTNRPPSAHRIHEWHRRPYVRHIIALTAVMTIVFIPVGFVVVNVMNQSGGPASAIMVQIERTILIFVIVCAPLMAFTASVLIYSLLGRGWGGRVSGDEPPMQENPSIRTNKVGVTLWITITCLLAAFLVMWGLIELSNITSYANGSVEPNQQPNAVKPIDVNVTGQQWLWSFSYPDQSNITSDVLYAPVNTPMYFNITSKDVIHSFWIVELGVKIDVNPGAITNTGVTPTKLGTFNIRCAELCGLHHAYMQTQIKVVTQDQFTAWVREMGGRKTA